MLIGLRVGRCAILVIKADVLAIKLLEELAAEVFVGHLLNGQSESSVLSDANVFGTNFKLDCANFLDSLDSVACLATFAGADS